MERKNRVPLPDARIGKLQGNVIKIKDKDIVFGMLQSIREEYI